MKKLLSLLILVICLGLFHFNVETNHLNVFKMGGKKISTVLDVNIFDINEKIGSKSFINFPLQAEVVKNYTGFSCELANPIKTLKTNKLNKVYLTLNLTKFDFG